MDNDRFYDESIRRYGTGAKGVHWKDEKSQIRRFSVLLEMLPPDLRDATLVDAGCGSAALYGYMIQRGCELKHYTGLEIKTEFIDAAKERFPGLDLRRCNVLYDRLPESDWYVCSGAMNILRRDETKAFITRCFAAAKQGFVFNLLEGDASDSMLYNYFRPQEIRPWAEEMGASMRWRRGYLRGDFTVLLRH